MDDQSLVLGAALTGCRCAYVTPSHQCPITVTMPLQLRLNLLARAERDDFVVIEDDHESELNFSGQPTPALKSAGVDTRELTARLYQQGVVVEPGDVFFMGARQPRQHLRIGYSSIPAERIEAGVRLIGRELAALARECRAASIKR